MALDALVEPSTGSSTTTMSRSAWWRPVSSDRAPNPAASITPRAAGSAARSLPYCPGRVPAKPHASTPVRPSSARRTAAAASDRTAMTSSSSGVRGMAEGRFGPVPIRNATVDDLEEISRLIVELAEYEQLAEEAVATLDDLRTHLFGPDPSAHVLMAESETGQVVGFALWYRTFSTWTGRPGIWLEDLFVRPEHRHQGFGLALLQRLRSMTDSRVEWSVLDWNEPS